MIEKLKENTLLYSIFFKIGLLSIGGGYVMLPMLQKEMVEKRKWLEESEILDYYAIGQATPGIIAINTATFVGFKRAGITGAFSATAGMVSPSLIIITMLSAVIPLMMSNILFQKAFMGIRTAVSVLLIYALFKLAKKEWKSLINIIITAAAFSAAVFTDISPVYIVIAAGITGFTAGRIKNRIKAK